jgi:hypothetical protein
VDPFDICNAFSDGSDGFLEGEKMVALTLISEIRETRILHSSIFDTQCTQTIAFITQMYLCVQKGIS